MATAGQIRDGLFRVSWAVKKRKFRHLSDQTEVNLTKVFQPCKLRVRTWNQQLFLEVDIAFPTELNSPEVFNHVIILASKDSVQNKMAFIAPSIWKTGWSFYPEDYYCQNCGTNSDLVGFSFEILIDFQPNTNIPVNESTKKGTRNALGLLSNLWEDKNCSDVTFKFANKTIEAHTLILASASPVLAAMFQHDFQENRERVVEIQDIAPNVFESLLRYIYTGIVDFKSGDEEELMVVADKYGIVSLKEESAQVLSHAVCLVRERIPLPCSITST